MTFTTIKGSPAVVLKKDEYLKQFRVEFFKPGNIIGREFFSNITTTKDLFFESSESVDLISNPILALSFGCSLPYGVQKNHFCFEREEWFIFIRDSDVNIIEN